MVASDRQEKERIDARNALEEYVYELRGKLCSEEELATFVNENDRNSLCHQLDGMENWLYEEGEDCNRQVYVDKLNLLKVRTWSWFISLKCLHKIVSIGTTKNVNRN
jgi:heat shock protein